jgi:hypothetical protein
MRASASLIGIRNMADPQPTSLLFSWTSPMSRSADFGGQSSEFGRLPAGYRLHWPQGKSQRKHKRIAMAITVAELSDREEIRQVMYKFFRATDRRDKELARSVFWEDGHCESGESRWMPSNLGDFGSRFERDFESTIHYMINMIFKVEGDVAFVETYAIAYHLLSARPEDVLDVIGPTRFAEIDKSKRHEWWMGLRYNSRFEKREGTWRIKIHRYIPEWTKVVPYEGNAPGEGYLQFMPLRALRGREDASYEWFA